MNGGIGSWLVGSTRAKRNLKSFLRDLGSGVDTALKSCKRRAKIMRLPTWMETGSPATAFTLQRPEHGGRVLSLRRKFAYRSLSESARHHRSPRSQELGRRASSSRSSRPSVLLCRSCPRLLGQYRATAELPNPTHHTCVQPFRLRLTAVTHRIILAASTSFIYLFGLRRHYYSSGRNRCRQRSRPLAEPVDFIFARPYFLDHNRPRRHWHNI
jgi:hypothetical protein